MKLTASEYFAAHGLSNSGLKDLAISPLRYWYRHVNPKRTPDEPTPEMQFGSALHAAVLEPNEFDHRYVCRLDKSEIKGCLETMEDLKGWLSERGLSTTAKKKEELITRVHAVDPAVPILDVLKIQHEIAHHGKTQFKKDEWYRIGGAAQALRREYWISGILQEPGQAEAPMFATDPDTGVILKAKMDWITDGCTLDLKTFSQQREKSIERSVGDAIYYERYYIQAYFYSLIRGLQEGSGRKMAQQAPPFILAFVERDEPHEVRIKSLQPKSAGVPNMYWEIARTEVGGMIHTYAKHLEKYGDAPWRQSQEIDLFTDENIPQLAY